jgi:RNA polymerase sigma-70 factor, ECF subfamily
MPHNPAYRTEEELIEGLRSEAPGALEAFLDRYADLSYSVAVKIAGQAEEAKRLLREAVAKTLASLRGLKSAKSLERQLLRDTCILLQDQGGNGPAAEVKLEDLLPELRNGQSFGVADWSLDPGEEDRRSEEKRAVRDVVAAMPRPYALVLVLHDMEEVSAHNVADILQIPGQAVKDRLHRARLLLRSGLTSRLGGAAPGSGKAANP